MPYIALTEVNARFDVRVVDFKAAMHLSEDFLQINPKHAVPVLVVDGEVLTENVAILQWIADSFPDAGLLPTGGMEKYRALSFLAWCASGIHPFLTPNALPARYCDLPGSEDSVRRCAKTMLVEKFRIAELSLAAHSKWFFGDFSLADIYFFWCYRRAIIFDTDLTPFTSCLEHFNRMAERSSTRRLLAFEAETIAQLQSARSVEDRNELLPRK